MGSGRSQVAEAIFGLHPATGTIEIGRQGRSSTEPLRRRWTGDSRWSRKTAAPIKSFPDAAFAKI